MRLRALGGIIALAVVALPREGRAIDLTLLDAPLQLNVTEYGAVAYHWGNGAIAAPGHLGYDPTGKGYLDWLNRLQVDAAWKGFTALLRLDTDLFVHAPTAPTSDPIYQQYLISRFRDRVDVEKVAVGYTNRFIEVTLGDSYVTYGRGFVLALRKEDELGVDTTVRGVSLTGHVAGLNVNAVAGVSNVVNVDTGTGRVTNDPQDLIVGGRAEYRFGKWVVPGVDASLIRYGLAPPYDLDDPYAPSNFAPGAQRGPSTRDYVAAYSATLEFPNLWNHGNLYFEYAGQSQHLYDTNLPVRTAFYAAGTGYWGPVTVLAEFKNYASFQPIKTSINPAAQELYLTDFYNAPPTLERIDQAVLDNTDVVGPHVRVDVAITPDIIPFVSMAGFKDRFLHVYIYDPYAGIEAHWQGARSRLAISGGRRISRSDDTNPVLAGMLALDTTHIEYDINQWITGPYSVELDGKYQRHHDRNYSTVNTWTEGQSYLSFKWAERFSVAAGYEFYSEFPLTTRVNYFNGNASVNVTKNVLVRLFAGGQRAGIKCVNGVCRNFPAFEGTRAEVLAKW